MEIEESSLKSEENEASSVIDFISPEDELEEKFGKATLQLHTSDNEGEEKYPIFLRLLQSFVAVGLKPSPPDTYNSPISRVPRQNTTAAAP
ncbi:hypothetical protein LSTR_LSTR009534 [Laodelphax striatellus]|uniref:Uncharacterized protein n=1 Tax=Laodelphax striatellus TaxID=195883 RepID=A0A482XQ61_LAOST|nr:hypothetical protein LSTR_LSTR009534 [Laodelphax striatellus]